MLKICAAIFKEKAEKAPKSFSGYFGELVVFVFAAKGDEKMAKKRANGEGSIRKRSDGAGRGAIQQVGILRPASLYTKMSSAKLRPRLKKNSKSHWQSARR